MTSPATPDPLLNAPPARLGCYRILEILGAGGMGTVYMAQDLELDRTVAIKWLAHATPATFERLKVEAQLHARVEHPAVCRLYSVAEHEGRPYLVMQYIHGQTLNRAAPSMNLETKLRLMVTLADGVHAAHQQGLIHRDIKPSNLMVERDEAGLWRPYVMDFGLARDTASSIHSEAGLLLGSPAYMAPEQIEGGWVDPRADVYGLGASLFELLTGRPPFLGSTTTEILAQVQSQEAPALRSLCPDSSQDLEVVLQTCLAKEPSRRYPSAAALRNDLQRILDGEPVKTRRISLPEKCFRWMGRNRLASAMAATVCILLLGTGGVWIHIRRQARARTYWAQRFGQDVIQMENVLRFGRMLPPHDLSPEFDQVRQQMEKIRSQMNLDKGGTGPGHFALGEGYLLLGRPDAAKRELDTAWNSGFRAPEVSLALGRCFLEFYESASQEIQTIQDASARGIRSTELRHEFLDPALACFKTSRQTLGSLPKLEAMFHARAEQRFDDAVTLAESVHAAEPWRYETMWHMANACSQKGLNELMVGHIQNARASLEKALDILENAGRVGPSDDRIFATMAEVWTNGRAIGLRGKNQLSSLKQALADNERALAMNPHREMNLITQGTILGWLGYSADPRIEDPEPYYQRAATVIQRWMDSPGEKSNRSRAQAQNQLLLIHSLHCFQNQGRPGLVSMLETGLQSYTSICRAGNANAETHKFGGGLHYLQSQLQIPDSIECKRALERALDAFQKCAEQRSNIGSLNNVIMILNDLAHWEMVHDQDPAPYFKQSKEAIRKAQEMAPDIAENHAVAGHIAWYEALWASKQNQDPMPFLEKARVEFEKAQDAFGRKQYRDISEIEILAGLARVHMAQAETHLERREDPVPDARQAITYARKAVASVSHREDGPGYNLIIAREALINAQKILRTHGRHRE